jgi:hypothetical protein
VLWAPGTSQRTVQLQVARTVGFLGFSAAQLKTTLVVSGFPFLPFGRSSLLYRGKNGAEYYLEIDGTPKSGEWSSSRSVTLWLGEGTEHEIRMPKVIDVDPSTRYYCEENLLSLSSSDVSSYLKTRPHSLLHTFMYVEQFPLRVNSWADDNQTLRWFDTGSSVTIETDRFAVPSNISLLFRFLGVRYRFLGWTGTIESDSPTVSLVMNRPINATALWAVDYSQTLVAGAVLVISTGLLALLLIIITKSAVQVDYETLLQRLETLRASGAISEHTYTRLRSEYEKRRR